MRAFLLVVSPNREYPSRTFADCLLTRRQIAQLYICTPTREYAPAGSIIVRRLPTESLINKPSGHGRNWKKFLGNACTRLSTYRAGFSVTLSSRLQLTLQQLPRSIPAIFKNCDSREHITERSKFLAHDAECHWFEQLCTAASKIYIKYNCHTMSTN